MKFAKSTESAPEGTIHIPKQDPPGMWTIQSGVPDDYTRMESDAIDPDAKRPAPGIILKRGQTATVPTGLIGKDLPEGYWPQLVAMHRYSSMGVIIVNVNPWSPRYIEQGGPLAITFQNNGTKDVPVYNGTALATMFLTPCHPGQERPAHFAPRAVEAHPSDASKDMAVEGEADDTEKTDDMDDSEWDEEEEKRARYNP